MKNFSKKSKNILSGIFLAVVLSAQNIANADGFSYLDINNAFDSKHAPILLDTSKAERITPKAHTSIPFNLREFSEADYFSSEIEDLSTLKQSIPPSETLQEETVASSNMETISNDEE